MMRDELTDRLEQCYSGAVYDVLREMQRPEQVLPPTVRPLDPTQRLAGKIYTVSGHRDPHLDPHATLLSWTALLSQAPADSVVVCQPNDSTLAHMGELSAETLKLRGVRGFVVDGGCRDTDFIMSIGFPVFCRYLTPRDVVGNWIADRYGEPVEIGGVLIATGDYLLADRDGVVIIPAALATEVVSRTETVMQTESLVRRAIREGMDPQEAYLKYGKF